MISAQSAELNLRTRSSGPPVAPRVTLESPVSLPGLSYRHAGSPQGSHAILLLIHGFNVSRDDARKSYANFIKALDHESDSSVSMPIYQVMWPGDESNPVISRLSYYNKIAVALEAGDRLAEFLRRLHGPDGTPIDVHIVAHSLGNRVLLQMLKRLIDARNLVVRSATLMAAAVPVESVTFNHEFFWACTVPRETSVLHSWFDWVLDIPFRGGESIHNLGKQLHERTTWLPTAVGSFGHPTATWTRRSNCFGYLHEHYWDKLTPPRQVLETLQRSVTRSVATARPQPQRATASRTVGQGLSSHQ